MNSPDRAAQAHQRKRFANGSCNQAGVLQGNGSLVQNAIGILEFALRLFCRVGMPIVSNFPGLLWSEAD